MHFNIVVYLDAPAPNWRPGIVTSWCHVTSLPCSPGGGGAGIGGFTVWLPPVFHHLKELPLQVKSSIGDHNQSMKSLLSMCLLWKWYHYATSRFCQKRNSCWQLQGLAATHYYFSCGGSYSKGEPLEGCYLKRMPLRRRDREQPDCKVTKTWRADLVPLAIPPAQWHSTLLLLVPKVGATPTIS